jgi:hypothetical protein
MVCLGPGAGAQTEVDEELGLPACLSRGPGPAAWPLANRPPKSMRGGLDSILEWESSTAKSGWWPDGRIRRMVDSPDSPGGSFDRIRLHQCGCGSNIHTGIQLHKRHKLNSSLHIAGLMLSVCPQDSIAVRLPPHSIWLLEWALVSPRHSRVLCSPVLEPIQRRGYIKCCQFADAICWIVDNYAASI